MDNTPLPMQVSTVPFRIGLDAAPSSKERCIIRIAAWVFRGGVLSHMARVNFSQAMPCSHVNTTPQSRQFSGRYDSSPLGLLLIPASSGYVHFLLPLLEGALFAGRFYTSHPRSFGASSCQEA
ncbi:hypothetical protein ACN42_g4048 [Penicillium freii]|uniref:Uncharacterized protein n=1 Tax=Penicillium freii TaxID=48697 RepID=A0A101MM33_PENFR|nr:hypothetical protein ACN42_g4048 [Penicillium freii]